MYNTYKLLSSATTDVYLNKTLEELVEEYKKTDNCKKRNKIISAMFCKVFPMILKIQEKYYSLTNEQKVEHAIFHLIRSIRYYDSKKNKVKFSSFFYTHLTNQMKTLLSSENSLKKAAFQNIVRNNDEVLTIYTQNTPDKTFEYSEEYFIQNLNNSTYLSSEEKEYLICQIQGYTKTRDIAKKLDLDNRYSLSKKTVTNPLAVMDIQKRKELDDKIAIRRVRKIRESLQKKYDKYGSAIFS